MGRRFVGWPFGRLDVADDALVMRFWPLPRSAPRSAPKRTIKEIHIRRRYFRVLLTIDDSEGVFRDISLEVPYGIARLIRELNAQGYLVIDAR